MESFKFVTPVSESSNSIDVERVFSLTDGGDSLFQPGDVGLLVGLLTVVWAKKKVRLTMCQVIQNASKQNLKRQEEYLPDVSSHVWPAPPCWECGKPVVDHWETAVAIFQTQVAAGCGETHCGWRALQTRGKCVKNGNFVFNPTCRSSIGKNRKNNYTAWTYWFPLSTARSSSSGRWHQAC